MQQTDFYTGSLPTLFFIHVPRTAGTIMRAILKREYLPEECIELYDHEDQNRFKALPSKEKPDSRVILGHFPYGRRGPYERPSSYLTVIRDPVARVLSLFIFQSSKSEQQETPEAGKQHRYIHQRP